MSITLFSHVLRNVKTDSTYNDILQQLRPIAEHVNQLKSYYVSQGTPELSPHATVPDGQGMSPRRSSESGLRLPTFTTDRYPRSTPS